ncbi:recombinase RecT [Bradyrhizobium sp. USDA 4350]
MARQATATRERPAQAQAAPQQAPTGNLPATTNGETKAPHPLMVLKGQLEERQSEFAFVLPDHIPPQRFTRVCLTAVQINPKLLTADRASFFNAALKAAQDGLLPDGREGAIVDYKDNKTGKVLAQWMPMYQGLLKKVRNSGEFKWMTAQIVYEGDLFKHWIDTEGEHFEHEPAGLTERPLKAYSAVTTKSGGAFVEVMTMAQVAKVRAASRVKSEYGPWAKWFDEMAKKSAFRRLAKRLPISSDLDDLIRRDDALYDFEGQREEAQIEKQARRQLSTAQAFDRFAGGPTIDNATGEVDEGGDDDFGGELDGAEDADFNEVDDTAAEQERQRVERVEAEARAAEETAKRKAAEEAAAKAAREKQAQLKKQDPISSGPQPDAAKPDKSAADASPAGAAQPAGDNGGAAPAGAQDQAQDDAAGPGASDSQDDPGIDAQDRRWPNGAVPSNADEYEHYAETKLADFTVPGEVAPWWKGQSEIALRKACQVPQGMFERILKKAQNRVAILNRGPKK